jgi:hypothetical protein
MDAETELAIEVLPTGSVLNAHNMLADRKHNINARFTTNTSFYYLKYSKLVEVASNYPAFVKILVHEKGKAESNKSREMMPLDYISGCHVFYDVHGRSLDHAGS